MQRVVGAGEFRLLAEKEIVPRHRPDSANVTEREQHLPIISRNKLVDHVGEPREDEDPGECEMQLERAAEPPTHGGPLRNVDEILLRDLGAEAGESFEDPKSGADHDEQ